MKFWLGMIKRLAYLGVACCATLAVASGAGAGPARDTAAASVSAAVAAGTNDLPRPFATGDIFVSAGSGNVNWYDASGAFVGQLTTGLSFVEALAVDPSGRLWAVDNCCSLARIDETGAWQTFPVDATFTPSSLTFDALGNVYVGDEEGDREHESQPEGRISKFSSTGAFLGVALVVESDYIDLAADQCTMVLQQVWNEESGTERWNICTGTRVDVFGGGVAVYGLRLLPDGSMLIKEGAASDGADQRVIRRDLGGEILRVYSFPECTLGRPHSLSPDGGSFYAHCPGQGYYEVDVATGARIRTLALSTTLNLPLTVMGGYRAGATAVPKSDFIAPTIAVAAPVEGAIYTLGQMLTADYSCADTGGSGMATCIGDWMSGDSRRLNSVGQKTFKITASDRAGNVTSTTVQYGVFAPDNTPPTASMLAPAEGATYAVGQSVTVDYSCADSGSGIESCVGDQPDGAALDTSTAGARTFSVTARDRAGNAFTATAHYSVGPAAFAINDVMVVEGGDATLLVTLSRALASTATVRYAMVNGTGKVGTDFVKSTGKLTFAPGEVSKPIVVPTVAEALYELDETVLVNLSSPTGAVLADTQGVVTIANDDPLPTLTIVDGERVEGAAGTTAFLVFTVNLSAPSGVVTKVSYATANGTATVAGNDYRAKSGTLTIPIGATSTTISITIRGDGVDEPNEAFGVLLSAPSNAAIADGDGVGTILDDD